jgi:FkbH-like protein
MQQYDSFADLLEARAGSSTLENGYTIVSESAADQGLHWAELDRRARIIAYALTERNAAGKCVLLIFPTSLDYIAALFGCFYAGAIAAPVYPPRRNAGADRVRSIVQDSGAELVLTNAKLAPRIHEWGFAAQPVCAIDIGTLPEEIPSTWRRPAISTETVAFVQYTSGSTGSPKGVMLTHGNLLHNSELLRRVFGYGPESRVVSWLPMYHDMGLIGGVLQPLYGDFSCVLMDPAVFIRRPTAWLEAISHYRGTISGAPNFAYDLCVRRVTQATSLDLSCWEVAFNGAEPVRQSTMDEFSKRFAAHGFRRDAFLPCYGLAEATLIVAAGERGGRSDGYPDTLGQRVTVDADGEIRVSGGSVALGYWGRPDDSKAIFVAEPNGTIALRTGDLGVFRDGRLHIAGRLKDLIIIRGQNHYPQDIEATVERAHPALRPAGGAAFSVDVNGSEQLVIVHEIERSRVQEATAAFDSVREAVSRIHGLKCHAAHFIRPGTLPKTSSGKVRRRACRDAFQNRLLQTLWSWEDSTGESSYDESVEFDDAGEHLVEKQLRYLASRIVGVDPDHIAMDHSLYALGFDSLQAIEFQHSLDTKFGIALTFPEILGEGTLTQIAKLIGQRSGDFSPALAPRPATSNPAPVSLEQERIWLFEKLVGSKCAHTLVAILRLDGPLEVEKLDRALREIMVRHQVLRARFFEQDGQLCQLALPAPPLSLDVEPYAESGESAIERLLAEETNKPFDLDGGRTWRFRLLQQSPERHLLIVAMHHIVGDAWSLRVLLHEIQTLYEGAVPPPLPIEYGAFAAHQRANEAKQSVGGSRPFTIPTTLSRTSVRRFGNAQARVRVPAETVLRLRELGRQEHATLFMVLIAAFQTIISRYSGESEVSVAFPVAGRARAELGMLIGFFAQEVVLKVDVSSARSMRELLGRVRQATLDTYDQVDHRPRTPPTSVAFSLLPPLETARAGDLQFGPVAVSGGTQGFDLFLTVMETQSGLEGTLIYDPEVFDDQMARHLVHAYEAFLETVAADPNCALSCVQFGGPVPADVLAPTSPDSWTLAVSATFTAEPVGDSLAFWMEQLGIPAKIRFAPYGQVFQELIDSSNNALLACVLLLRLEDWGEDLEGSVRLFLSTLETSRMRCKDPVLICICPPSQAACSIKHQHAARLLEESAARVPGVTLITEFDIAAHYPLNEPRDPYAASLASVPYTPAYFACLGTALARQIRLLAAPPIKVIAVDCDNTLWKGICGEDGPDGIEIDAAASYLQTLLRKQHKRGMLICLLSKNNPFDVLETFTHHAEMPLQMEHIVSYRINWEPKSKNLTGLAHELRLGLESFLFIDDDPWECSEVRARCPSVNVVQLPQSRASIPGFLDHVWALDQSPHAAEDLDRTAKYQEEFERRSVRESVGTMDEFLAVLQLQIEIAPLARGDIARVAQLSARTNQFNANKQRLSEGELYSMFETGVPECLVVRVTDRFGDYGLVGATGFKICGRALEVDMLFLSCRALGRRVEYQMLSRLGAVALGRNCDVVRILARDTGTNRPAIECLDRLGGVHNSRESFYEYSATYLLDCPRMEHLHPSGDLPPGAEEIRTSRARVMPSLDMTRIALEFQRPEPILAAVELRHRTEQRRKTAVQELERMIRKRASVHSVDLRILQDLRVELEIGAIIGIHSDRAALDAREIESAWRDQFPDIPAAFRFFFVEVQHPTPTRIHSESRRMEPVSPPRTPTERNLVDIWTEFLGITPGIHSNFFDLGGHSFMATRVLSRVRERFGVELSFNVFFNQPPTIAEIARVIDERQINMAGHDEVTQALAELDALSDEEIRNLLSEPQ